MEYDTPRQKIDEMKEFLRQHPINPEWDVEADSFDGVLPCNEEMARLYQSLLEDLGELD